VVDQIYVVVPIADDAQDITKIGFMVWQIVDIKPEIKIFCKTDGIIRRNVQGSSFFKYVLMTAERQTIGLATTLYLRK
jgi:hypothetical protein